MGAGIRVGALLVCRRDGCSGWAARPRGLAAACSGLLGRERLPGSASSTWLGSLLGSHCSCRLPCSALLSTRPHREDTRFKLADGGALFDLGDDEDDDSHFMEVDPAVGAADGEGGAKKKKKAARAGKVAGSGAGKKVAAPAAGGRKRAPTKPKAGGVKKAAASKPRKRPTKPKGGVGKK